MSIKANELINSASRIVDRRISAEPEISKLELHQILSRCWPFLGRENWADKGVVARSIDGINDESNQRAFYRGWAQFASGASRDKLGQAKRVWEKAGPPASNLRRG